MNKRQKIIVSIVGITIVLLALLGITYAYYLTRIEGNTNTNSISVTTAKLELVYGNDDGRIIGDNEVIEPGKEFISKTFTVTNNGNETIEDYAVILEGVSITDVTTNLETDLGSTTDGKENDFTLVIMCKNQDNKDCNGYNAELLERSGILLTNSIEKDEVQTYTAFLTYNETGFDQSDDMNKKYNAKFNIIDTKDTIDLKGNVENYSDGDYVQTNSIKRISSIYKNGTYKIMGLDIGNHTIKVCSKNDVNCDNPKKTETIKILKGDNALVDQNTNTITITNDSREVNIDIDINGNVIIGETIINLAKPPLLSDVIIDRAKSISETDSKTLGYAMYSESFSTIPGREPSASDESLLLTAEDDYGISYYFRGNVKDNYLSYSGMCWRIVRILGNGDIKLVLSDRDNVCGTANGYDINDGQSGFVTDLTQNFAYRRPELWEQNNFIYANSDVRKVLDAWAGIGDTRDYTYYVGYTANNATFTNDILDLSKLTENPEWCNDLSISSDKDTYTTYFNSYSRLSKVSTASPTLKCDMQGVDESVALKYSDSPVAVLTVDEVAFAGSTFETSGYTYNYYLQTNASDNSYWTMTPYSSSTRTDDDVWWVSDYIDGTMTGTDNGLSLPDYSIRPAVILRSDLRITGEGNGTINNPYVIN